VKYRNLIPRYACLLCDRRLSEAIADASQHLVQRAVDTGVLRVEEWRAGPNQQLEPQMRWLLEASEASGEPELRGLLSSLEDLLLREFSGEIPDLHDTSARQCGPPELC
jgi:hypothetical protein